MKKPLLYIFVISALLSIVLLFSPKLEISTVLSAGEVNYGSLLNAYSVPCAIFSDGELNCWGQNNVGQVGVGTISAGLLYPTPVLGFGGGAIDVGAGGGFACAISTIGGVKCWGSQIDDQLGDVYAGVQSTPVEVTGISSGAKSIAVGESFSCVLMDTGAVKCWGQNNYGQLGRGFTSASEAIAADVVGLTTDIVKISATAFSKQTFLNH
jgi:alpha-tubulin suppressor-like RCC1 family protein